MAGLALTERRLCVGASSVAVITVSSIIVVIPSALSSFLVIALLSIAVLTSNYSRSRNLDSRDLGKERKERKCQGGRELHDVYKIQM